MHMVHSPLTILCNFVHYVFSLLKSVLEVMHKVSAIYHIYIFNFKFPLSYLYIDYFILTCTWLNLVLKGHFMYMYIAKIQKFGTPKMISCTVIVLKLEQLAFTMQ